MLWRSLWDRVKCFFLMSRNTSHMDLLLSREKSQDCAVKSRTVSVEKHGWKPNCLSDKKFCVVTCFCRYSKRWRSKTLLIRERREMGQ